MRHMCILLVTFTYMLMLTLVKTSPLCYIMITSVLRKLVDNGYAMKWPTCCWRRILTIFNVFNVFQTNSSNRETLLKHAQEENHFYSFSSYLYPSDQSHATTKWLLAIGSKGRMRNASRVQPGHKSHQFQITEMRKKTKTNDLRALLRLMERKGKWKSIS